MSVIDGQGYFLLLKRALAGLEDRPPGARRVVYDRIEAAQTLAFEAREPLPEAFEMDIHYRLLRYMIRIVETDIRNGVDIQDEAYSPIGLEEIERRLEKLRLSHHARSAGLAATTAASLEEAEEEAAAQARAERLGRDLLWLDTGSQANRNKAEGVHRLGVIRALLILQFQMIAAESRIAIVWTLIQPAVLLALISGTYFILGTHYILNMDVPTFALLGGGSWIMCRQVIFRVSSQIAHQRILINLPPVKPIDAALSQALLYLIIYIVVGNILFLCGHLLDYTSLPDHLGGVIFYFLAMWIFAISLGLILGAAGAHWPYCLRFASVLERTIQAFSSIFFVSEQLPEAYKPWLLWCPTAHGMQLMKSAYFQAYPSTDASPTYFLVCLALLLAIGLTCEWRVRWRLHPV